MKNIKIVTDSLDKTLGGGPTYLQAFVEYFAKLDYEMNIVENYSQQSNQELFVKKGFQPFFRRIKKNVYRILADYWNYQGIIFKSNYIPVLSVNKLVLVIVDFPLQTRLTLFDKIKLRFISSVVCNSQYTASWIRSYWGVDPVVIYPPARIGAFNPVKKKPIILSVGRFVNNQRSKRQDILIDAFKIIIDKGCDCTLKLVGFVQDAEYIKQLKVQAGEYPVDFLTDISEEVLEELYQSATFYWHACGFGVDASSEPGRVEHFGIAVADALSFGCIPFVYANGGPCEIVGAGRYGCIWTTQQELADKTSDCIAAPELMLSYQQKALERSHLFSKKMFVDSLKNIESFYIN